MSQFPYVCGRNIGAFLEEKVGAIIIPVIKRCTWEKGFSIIEGSDSRQDEWISWGGFLDFRDKGKIYCSCE
jgi:hypothetical protein